MKMQFLGCGAADFDWSRYGEEGILGSTASLLNDNILLDCGPTAALSLKRFNIPLEQIKTVINTHSHSDHFNVDVLREISGDRKIDFYGSKEACAKVADFCTVHPLTFGETFAIGACSFLVLPSNHAVEDLHEETFNYLINCDDKTMLYALDTAWMPSRARKLIGQTFINAIIWDGTMSEPDDWRIFDHSDPEMFTSMRRVWLKKGIIDENTVVYFTHRARTLWPADIKEQQAIADKYNVNLAIEGETVVF